MREACKLKCMQVGCRHSTNLRAYTQVVYIPRYTVPAGRPMYIQEVHTMGRRLMYMGEGCRQMYRQGVYRHAMIPTGCMLVGCRPMYTQAGCRPMYNLQVGCMWTYMALANGLKCMAAEYMLNCIPLVCTEAGYRPKYTGVECRQRYKTSKKACTALAN